VEPGGDLRRDDAGAALEVVVVTEHDGPGDVARELVGEGKGGQERRDEREGGEDPRAQLHPQPPPLEPCPPVAPSRASWTCARKRSSPRSWLTSAARSASAPRW